MDVERLKRRCRALRRVLRRALRHAAKPRHLFRREKLAIIRPSLGALRGADLDEPALIFQNLQFVPMFHRRRYRRFGRQFLPQRQRGGSNVRRANRTRLALRWGARNQKSYK
jgi:hypothetical protein